jgi:T5SS/PEP-CTERM-associated repeat protein
MRARPLAAILLLVATAALAARTDEGQVFVIPQPPFAGITVIGVQGSGTVTIDDGTQVELPAVAMGGLSTADGTLRVRDAGSKLTTVGDPETRANTVAVGVAGAGTLEITDGGEVELDGSNNLAGDPLGASFAVGVEAGSTGGVTIDGGTLTVTNGGATPGGVAVGVGGSGIVHLEGAQLSVDTGTGANSGFSVGTSQGSTGFVHARSASTISLAGSGRLFSVGTGGTGEVVLEQESLVTGAQIAFIGLEATGDGTVRVGGQAQLAISGFNPLLGFGGALQVGAAGTGLLEVQGGGVVVIDEPGATQHGVQIGGTIGCGGPCPFTGGTGEIAVVGGELQILGAQGSAVVGSDGDGTLRVTDGGSFSIENPDDGSGISVGATAGSAGTVLVRGDGSVLDAGVGLVAGLDLEFEDAGSADLTVADGGTLVAQAISLGSDAVLRGDGTVSAAMMNSVSGTIAPGESIGTLTVTGGVASGGVLEIEAAGTAAGEFDVIASGGLLEVITGTVRIVLREGFLPRAGDELAIGTGTKGVEIAAIVVREVRGAAPGFDFEIAAEGNALVFRALNDAEGFGACQIAQLKAASKLCKKHFDCQAAFAKKPAKDPGGTKRDACLAAGTAAYAKAYDKAVAKAAQKEEPCGSTAPAAEADDVVVDAVAELVAGIETGWTAGEDAEDDVLRGALLGSSGTLCAALLKTESGQVKKRDAGKRDAARAKAAQKFDAAAAKALAKATGVTYDGTPPAEISEAVLEAASDATGATAGVAP